MLKFVFVVILAAATVQVGGAHHRSHENQNRHFSNYSKEGADVVDIIKRNGYPVERHLVQTEDGYLLEIIRIPHGIPRSNSRHDKNSSPSSQDDNNEKRNLGKKPVLLLPGMVSNAEDYVLGGRQESLAFMLADDGYDVFLGNVRGSKYGRKHTTLDPHRDAAFWRFCWDDIALKDLPAIIDGVLRISNKHTLGYIGHMQGSTIFYVLGSKVPGYNSKVRAMVTLGPLAFLGNTRNEMMKLTSSKMDSKGWIAKNLGDNEMKLSHEAIEDGGARECRAAMKHLRFCENPYFLVNGFNSRRLNGETIRPIVDNPGRPTGTSTRGMLHFGQLVKSGRFTDYQNEDIPLNKLKTPTFIFYTLHDMTSTPTDVETLIQKLPEVREVVKVTELTNNLDLLFGNDVANIVYEKVLHILKEHLEN